MAGEFNRGVDRGAVVGDLGDDRRQERTLVADSAGNTYVADSVHDGLTNWDFLVAKYGPSGSLLWSSRLDSPSPGSQDDFATALAIDENGNVYLTGYSSGNPGGTDVLTAKYNSAGIQQWAVLHNGAGNPWDNGRAIALDVAGNVFVAGERGVNAGDYLIVKYSSGGALQWSATFDGATHGEERLFGLAVDSGGSPYVTGWSRDAVSGSSDFMTVRWSAAGSQLWAVPFDNPAAGAQDDWAYGLELDAAGNAFAVGGSAGQFMTLKYSPAGTLQWAIPFGGVSLGEANAVTVDANGDVLVTGSGVGGASGWDLVTVKYDSAGNQHWAAVSENPESGAQTDTAFAIAVDASGNVCVAGNSRDLVTSRYDYLTAKYDAAGVELWVRAFDHPLAGAQDDFGVAVGVDGSGNVLTGGRSSGVTMDARIVKYDAAGTFLWTAIEPPSGATTDRVASEANQFARGGVAVDSAGRVAVTGLANDDSNYNDFMTVRYAPNGAQLWATAFENPAAGVQHDQAVAVAVDGTGNTYVTGQSFNGANWDYMTVKYDAAGAQQWATPFNGAFNSHDTPSAIAVGAGGDVYVTGQSVSATGYDYLTVKYNASGIQQWASSYNGSSSSDEYPYALHVDASGNAYVTGQALRAVTGWDVLTVKYNSAGVQQWAVPFAGAFNYDVGYAVSADAAGNVYVTGYVQIDGSTGDALTVKYNSAGVQQWARTWENPAVAVQHDMTYSHVLDASGNLYATGFSGSVGTGLYDYLTLKYDASGTLQWAQMFDNPAAGSQDDTAYSIALDGLGSVYVVGRSHNGSNQDMVTVRYDSAGTQQWTGTIDNGGQDYGTAIAAGPNGSIVVAGTSDGLGQDYVVAKYVAAESTPPVDPAIGSTSPPVSTWSNDNTVQVSWSGATDNPAGSGLAGYSVEWNHAVASTPDAVIDIPHTSDPHAATSPALVTDGNDWYFHLRTCDVAGNCTATVHAGPFWIDTTAPLGVSGLASSSHVVGVPAEADTISMSWSEPVDGGSGLDGYSWAFTGSASWTCESTKEAEEGTTSATSSALAAGPWYFHVCARDNAGNWGAVASAGPFQVTDTTLPTTCALPFERKWGSFGTGAGQFRRPFGVGAGPGGEVVVADFDNGRLQLFDGLGSFVRQWPTAGGPVSVALDSHGHAVVSNLYAGNVQVFALDGTLVDQWATGSPYGLTVDATDHVYAVNDTANVVTKYDHDGNFVLQFGSTGAGNGQFLRAWGVATAPGGDVFVTDVNGHNVQRFTSAGVFVAKWGSYGAGAGQLNAPAGITISPAGVVYVSEVANRRIQAFTLEGFPLCAWGSSGSGDGQFLDPLNVAFSTGHLYVADHLNHRIQKFGLDEIPPSDPTILSTSPVAGAWANDNTVQATWSGAADNLGGAGLAGYSVDWNHVAVATPNLAVDVPHTTDPHSTTSVALADGDDWYFHLRTCDLAGNCAAGVHAGPFWIDTTPPGLPGSVTSPSHGVSGVPTADPDLGLAWGAAADAGSGVDGYALALDASPSWSCDQVQDVEESVLSATFGGLSDGTYYVHLCAVDRAGTWGAVRNAGPFVVSSSAPSSDVMVYYTDYLAGELRRVRANGTDDTLVLGGLATPLGLAVDPRAGKLYFSQAGSDVISRCDLDGTGLETLVTGAGSGYEVALDLDGGKVYWAARAVGSIRRANLDGSAVETVLAGLRQPNGVAFDRTWRKVYWCEDSFGPPGANTRIGRVEPDGSAVEVLLTLPGSERGYALDVDPVQRQVYWSDTSTGWGAIHRFDYDGTGDTVLVAGVAQAQLQLEPVSRHLFWSEESDQVRRARADGSDAVTIVGPGGGGNEWGLGLLLPEAAPVAVPQALTTAEDTALPLRLRGFDPDDDLLTTWTMVSPPAHGSLSGISPELLYTPDPEYAGADSFTFTVGDGLATSPPATVAIAVAGVDDPPTDPALGAPIPPASTWTSDATVTISWSGAADDPGGSGLAGYSVEWNHVALTTPDATVDIAHTSDPHPTTSAPLADGSDWHFHLRTCDLAGNCTAGVHAGPFWIDTASPSAPGAVISTSHGDGLPKSDPTVEISWGAASDGLSGVASYRYGLTATATSPACSGLGTTTATLAGSSGNLADGTWFAHVCAVDGAGNVGAVSTGGPYVVDTTAPTGLVVSSSSHTVSTWSNDASIEFGFSGATDPSGVVGYAVVFDTAAGTVPACAATQAGQSFTGTASPDGSGWRLHVRAVDAGNNCGVTVTYGLLWIDTTAPPAPGTVVSPSHDGGATNDPTIDVEWGPSDAGAGAPITGYRFDFWSGAAPPACSALTGNATGTAASSPVLGEGVWYLSVCAVDGAGNESAVTTGGPYTIDTSGPTGLAVASTSHTLATWSSDVGVDFAFSGAIDPNGVAGYSIGFDQAAATVPDATPEQAGTTFTGTASPDSADWYLHVRACDSAGNCSTAVHAGPYRIDTTAPSATGALTSASHGDGEPHSDPTVAIAWGAASDALSGVDFYRYDFTALSGAPDCATLVGTTPDLTAVSASLADGSWYAHVCAVDATGNHGTVVSGGPFRIDTAPPTVEAFDSVARTADLALTEGEVVDQPLTQIYASFTEEMFDPPGDATPGDVTHPANWLLVASGPNGSIETDGCAVAGDDAPLPLAVTWSAATRTAHVALGGNQALAEGGYLVAACGTLLDPAGNPFDGDGNGTGGDARARTFAVRGTDLADNPNFDAGLAGWTVVATVPGEVAADLDDAGEQPTSGSVAVTSSAGAGEIWQVEQCVALPAHGWSRLSGRLRSASALANAPVAHLEAQYFGGADCSSGALGAVLTPAVAGDTGAVWVTLASGGSTFPPGATSASVRLIVEAGATNDVDLRADELFFGDDGLLFADGFESGDTGSWSSAMP